MPGPVPTYPTNAARQRAYRQRKRRETTAELREAELILAHAYALQAAVKAAQKAGSVDPLLTEIPPEDPIRLLRALADHFYDQAGTPRADRLWRDPDGTINP